MQGTAVLDTLEAVERAMDQVVQEHFFTGRFLRTLRAGAYSMTQIRYFAIQYSYYSRHFPRVLGAAISAMEPIANWWVPLADNLWDEAGRGNADSSHEALYRTFLLSVDPEIPLDKDGFPNMAMSPAIAQAVNFFIEFFRTASPLTAMAAVGLGSEWFAGDVMGAVGEGMKHPAYNREHRIDTRFWDVHATLHEPRHYQLCRDILSAYGSREELAIMYETGRRIALSEAAMYDRLHAEMVR